MTLTVTAERLPHGADLPLPEPASAGAAGADLRAAVDAPVVLQPGGWTAVPTGLRLALPAGYEGQVRPRSGLAARRGVTVLNAPGTIDSDYRGEIQVVLVNRGRGPVTFSRGERIAQLVVAPVAAPRFAEGPVESSSRGAGGFGSTGGAGALAATGAPHPQDAPDQGWGGGERGGDGIAQESRGGGERGGDGIALESRVGGAIAYGPSGGEAGSRR